jgi:hypothetical protein
MPPIRFEQRFDEPFISEGEACKKDLPGDPTFTQLEVHGIRH